MRKVARIFPKVAATTGNCSRSQWKATTRPQSPITTTARGFHCSAIGANRLQAEPQPRESSSFMGAVQQIRKYAPTSGQATVCWNCKKSTAKRNHMICEECGHLQDVDMEINYFDLLNFPKSFGLEAQALTNRFRQLQTIVHPDKYSNKSSREQTNSADWSSLINKAYKTLLVPIDRGQYMLRLHGRQIPQDNSALDKEFLMEMMERNEEVEEADTKEALQVLYDQISDELRTKVDELSAQFEAQALDAVTSILVQMKYLHSVQNSIKKKMHSMMGS